MKQLLLSSLTLCLLLSCNVEPRPIDYGSDKCEFCKMTIVDPRFGAEVVTEKGKVFKFDAIECMVNYIQTTPAQDYAFLLVNDFEQPSILVDAQKCSYLISKAVPSPMGAYLSAYQNVGSAVSMQEDKGGQTYDWHALQEYFQTEIGMVD